MSDFETTVDNEGARVWAWLLHEIESDEVVSRGTDIKSWYKCVMDLASNRSLEIYFHNLKFDGTFILDFILKNNLLKHAGDGPMEAGTYTTLISDMGVWYSIKICTKVHKNRKCVINIVDSLKKLPFSAKVIGEKWLGGDVTKGEIDYNAPRPRGYVPTDEEWDYIERDCLIISKALKNTSSRGKYKNDSGLRCIVSV